MFDTFQNYYRHLVLHKPTLNLNNLYKYSFNLMKIIYKKNYIFIVILLFILFIFTFKYFFGNVIYLVY